MLLWASDQLYDVTSNGKTNSKWLFCSTPYCYWVDLRLVAGAQVGASFLGDSIERQSIGRYTVYNNFGHRRPLNAAACVMQSCNRWYCDTIIVSLSQIDSMSEMRTELCKNWNFGIRSFLFAKQWPDVGTVFQEHMPWDIYARVKSFITHSLLHDKIGVYRLAGRSVRSLQWAPFPHYCIPKLWRYFFYANEILTSPRILSIVYPSFVGAKREAPCDANLSRKAAGIS